jgi:hypothetical protein
MCFLRNHIFSGANLYSTDLTTLASVNHVVLQQISQAEEAGPNLKTGNKLSQTFGMITQKVGQV